MRVRACMRVDSGARARARACACARVALLIQNAPQYFSRFSHKRWGFRKKKVTEHKVCVMIFSKTSI
jgi:hypothetical protein